MSEFINTIDVLGDDAVVDSIINRTITEFKDNVVISVGNSAFMNCTSLAVADLPALTYAGRDAFRGCGFVNACFPELTSADLYPFVENASLVRITLPKLEALGMWMLGKCGNLKIVDAYVAKEIYATCFQFCWGFGHLILRGDTVCSLLNANAFASTAFTSGAGYIYVPRALVDSYKAATNWSTYATQFRALEDYTVDGTITGELDETKI